MSDKLLTREEYENTAVAAYGDEAISYEEYVERVKDLEERWRKTREARKRHLDSLKERK